MAVLVAVAAGTQIVMAWTWFWPARWWDWLRNLSIIGYQGAADVTRSLIAWSISVWLVIGGFLIVFQVYGKRQPPAALVIPILARC